MKTGRNLAIDHFAFGKKYLPADYADVADFKTPFSATSAGHNQSVKICVIRGPNLYRANNL
jgi:hypothetical protein